MCPSPGPGQARVYEQTHLVQQIRFEEGAVEGAAAVDTYRTGALGLRESPQHRLQIDPFGALDQLPYPTCRGVR